MVPVSFIWVNEMFVSHVPTPAVWPNGGTLSSTGGPCLSAASWPSILRSASVRSNKGRWGVNGFGPFSSTTMVAPFGTRQATSSAAGPKPGNTGNPVDVKLGNNRCDTFTSQPFFTNSKMDSQHTSSSGKSRTINSV